MLKKQWEMRDGVIKINDDTACIVSLMKLRCEWFVHPNSVYGNVERLAYVM